MNPKNLEIGLPRPWSGATGPNEISPPKPWPGTTFDKGDMTVPLETGPSSTGQSPGLQVSAGATNQHLSTSTLHLPSSYGPSSTGFPAEVPGGVPVVHQAVRAGGGHPQVPPPPFDDLAVKLGQKLLWPHRLDPYTGSRLKSFRIDDKERINHINTASYPLAVLVNTLQHTFEEFALERADIEAGEELNKDAAAQRYSNSLTTLNDCEQLLARLQDDCLTNIPALREYLNTHIARLRKEAELQIAKLCARKT